MDFEPQITFYVSSVDHNIVLQLLEYDTVGKFFVLSDVKLAICAYLPGCLKDQIEKEFGIPKSRLVVTGWVLPPDTDNDVLKYCSHISDVNYLHVEERRWENSPIKEINEHRGIT